MKKQKMGVKRKRKSRGSTQTRRRTPPELMEDMVKEILVRLPVKSLLRFKPACRAWQAIIDDPVFIRAHLRRSIRLQVGAEPQLHPQPSQHVPSNRYRFHQWQLQRGTTTTTSPRNNVATFLHAKDLSDDQQFYTTEFTHCDGLVFSTTTTSLHVFNPATRDGITLPTSSRSILIGGGRFNYHCSGLGLDPRTGMYKVVQAFFRSQSMEPAETKMGMEVFTIGGGGGGAGWREITSDPPYPAKRFQIGVSVCGYMFWRFSERHTKLERGILHLSLEEEEFGITGLPDELDTDSSFLLDELLGRDLCVSASNTSCTMLNIWTLPVADESLCTLWQWRYCIEYPWSLCSVMALPPFSDEIILLRGNNICRYDLATSKLKIFGRLDRMRYQLGEGARKSELFSAMPFIESLVRITY
uniref:F-box domain-containing protein n=1 Tax=Oryza glumipatula TaxID=40148 RepID=A0A0D9YS69_9ORYZ